MFNGSKLTSEKLLFQNSLLNLAGQGLPLIAAIFCIPMLISKLGQVRFGLLTLIWVMIGYFGVFDFGIGRALTKLISERLVKDKLTEIPIVVRTGIYIVALLGFLIAIVLISCAQWVVEEVIKVPNDIKNEAVLGILILSISIPLVMLNASLRGILEAQQRFDLINLIRIPIGIINFVGPLTVVIITENIAAVISIIAFSRAIAFLFYLYFCRQTLPVLKKRQPTSKYILKQIIYFGGWMTIINIANPFLVSIDRFIVGALMPIAVVSYYTVPAEMICKLWIIPNALLMVLFPAFSALWEQKSERTKGLFIKGTKYIFIIMFPIVLFIIMGSETILSLWLDIEFSRESSIVLKLMAMGTLFNALAYTPFAFLQGIGRPDLIAKLLLAEIPIYIALSWYSVKQYGIVGAATVWTIRVFIETLIFMAMSVSYVKLVRKDALNFLLIITISTSVFCYAILESGYKGSGALFFTFIIYGIVAWKYMMSEEEKRIILSNCFSSRHH